MARNSYSLLAKSLSSSCFLKLIYRLKIKITFFFFTFIGDALDHWGTGAPPQGWLGLRLGAVRLNELLYLSVDPPGCLSILT